MRTELKAIAERLHTMELNGVAPHVVKERRDTEIKKLFETRQKKYDESITQINTSLKEIELSFNPPVKDDPVSLAKHMRLDATYSAMPSNKLSAMDLQTVDVNDLLVIAATMRKRGLHEAADDTYNMFTRRKDEWKQSPFVKDLEKLRTKINMLHAVDRDIYIGEDIDTITKEDFASVLSDGTIEFKNGDKVIRV